MLGLLLILAAQSAPAGAQSLMAGAAGRLHAAPEKPLARDYRVSGDDGGSVSAKDRAVADDGSHCSVVGARRCAHKARPIFGLALD